MDIDYTFAQMLYLCIAPRTGQQSQLQFQPSFPFRDSHVMQPSVSMFSKILRISLKLYFLSHLIPLLFGHLESLSFPFLVFNPPELWKRCQEGLPAHFI